MVKDGRRFYGVITQNICIQYFYAHERVNDGIIIVTYSPTKEMVSDYLSKPLQGSLFQTNCNTLMGITSEKPDQYKLEYAAAKASRAKATNDQ